MGYSAQTIAPFAHLQHCGQIVLGPLRDRTGVADRILGSLPRQIARLMEVAGAPCEVL